MALLFIIDATVISSAGLALSKILSNISKTQRGSIFGLQGFFSNLGAISGPLLGGFLWELLGDRGPFLLSIGVEFVLGVVYFTLFSSLFSARTRTPENKKFVQDEPKPS